MKRKINKTSKLGLTTILVVLAMLVFSVNIGAKSVNTKSIEDSEQTAIKVTGTVLDKQYNEPLTGVSVKIKGLDMGTITNIDGNFTLEVPYAEASLVFSYIGFQPQEIALKGAKEITVHLIEDTKALEEVIVVGYRTQRKESVTGAVSTITTKDLVQSPTANINNALAGRLPGLMANQHAGGEPGVDRADIFIRGQATYGNKSPIVIVDGVERDMSYLAPDEIESFTILKDASSTAPYGIRGANGVIVITTKRGQAAERATVNFKASVGFNSPIKLPELLGSADYAMLYNEAMRNDGLATESNLFSEETIANFRKAKGDNSDGLGYNNDYFDFMFKDAMIQNYNLSVRGGTDRARYFVLAGYQDQGTNYDHVDLGKYDKSAKFKRYNFRSNIDVDITKDFWVKLDLGARITDRTSPGTSAARMVNTAMTQPPHLPILLEGNENTSNTDYYQKNPEGLLYGDQIYRFNILGELSRSGFHTQKQTSLEGSFSMGHKLDFITEGLEVSGTFSYDYRSTQWLTRETGTYSEGYRQYPNYATFTPTDGRDVFLNSGHYGGAYKTGNKYDSDQKIGNGTTFEAPFNKTYYQFKLTYGRTFSELHEVSSMFLFNRSQEAVSGGLEPDFRYQGLTGQFTYGFDRKYLAEFNFGYNGSENFEKGKRYGFFPAGAIGWVISSENFMSGTRSWLDHLKARGSYGIVGNDRLGDNKRFAYLREFSGAGGYSFGSQNFGDGRGGLAEGDLSNTLLTWEKAKKLNIGLDAALLRQRLVFSIDYFHEDRYDILTNMSGSDKAGFPSIVGKGAPHMNIGKVTNQGIDFEVTWADKIGRDFRYSISPNMTFARNKIIESGEIARQHEWRAATGRRIDQNFVYIFDHFVKDQAEADKLNDMNDGAGFQPWGTLIPGDVVYKDLDGDGRVTDLNDRTAMGYARNPELQFGLPVTLMYKGFDFSVLFQGSANSTMRLTDAAVWDFAQFDQDKTAKVRSMHLNRWTPETAETAKYPALHIGAHLNNKNEHSSLFLYDSKYIRLKNIEVGYTLPKNIIRFAGLSQVRFYAQGQNLITWDKLKDVDLDPETRDGKADWYPILKVFNFGVDITF